MNEIRFTIEPAPVDVPDARMVSILIDGEQLEALVERHELPIATAEGKPSLAGTYIGLDVNTVAPPSRHFLGAPSWEIYRYGERLQVLGCECGDPGCWPLVCRIQLRNDQIEWSDFCQAQRSGHNSLPEWSYADFGPFVFNREAYERALQEITR